MTRPLKTYSNIRLSTNLLLVSFIIGVVILSGLISLCTNRGSLAKAYSLATSHQPERYTELYFNNAGQLPSYSPTGKSRTISFHITNHEARLMTYHFQTAVTVNNQTTITRGEVRLGQNQGADRSVSYVIPRPNLPAKIVVMLSERNLQISFRSTS